MSVKPPFTLPETLPEHERAHVLRRLRSQFDAGSREPGLLYSGARFALSLGLVADARQFLQPLLDMLVKDGVASHAGAAPLILSVMAQSSGPDADNQRAMLDSVSRQSQTLHWYWAFSQGQIDSSDTMPHARIERLRGDPALLGEDVVELLQGDVAGMASDEGVALNMAAAHYSAKHLEQARACMEDLIEDGASSTVEALRTLVAVTSELKDHSGMMQAWRRYVKLLMWQWLFEARDSALQELARFYRSVAAATDREFGAAGKQALNELLRRPGLLPRWLEAHSALVWIESISPAANRTFYPQPDGGVHTPGPLRHFWVRVFYPEFAAHVAEEWNPVWALPPALGEDHRKLDPAWRLLSRFAEWSKRTFAIEKTDSRESAHFQTVSAMAGLVARVPVEAHARELLRVLKDDELEEGNFFTAWHDAVGLPVLVLVNRHREKKEWAQISEIYPNLLPAHRESVHLRCMRALAFINDDKPGRALDSILPGIAYFEESDCEADAFARSLFSAAARQTAQECMSDRKESITVRQKRIENLVKKIKAVPPSGPAEPVVAESIKTLEEYIRDMHVEDLIDEVIKTINTCIEKDDYAGAEKAAKRLPTDHERANKLRVDALNTIARQKLWHETMEAVKKAIDKGDFAAAEKAISRVPDEPKERKEAKDALRKQVREIQDKWNSAKTENATLEQTLRWRNIDMFKVASLARQHNINTSNAIEYNGFLKAVLEAVNK